MPKYLVEQNKSSTFAIAFKSKGGYQSGQMGQTVNLLAMPSVVRIHHHPLFPNITRDKRVRISYEIWIFFVYTSLIPNQHSTNSPRS